MVVLNEKGLALDVEMDAAGLSVLTDTGVELTDRYAMYV